MNSTELMSTGLSNSTVSNNTVNNRAIAVRQFDWIISEVFDLFFIVTTIWFSVCMIAYVYKSGKWKLRKNDFTGGQVLLFAAATGPLTLPRYILTQTVLFIGYNPSPLEDYYCEYVEDASIILFGVSLIPTYIYLWFRQRTFYLQPSLKDLYTPLVKVLNWGSGFFMAASWVCVAVLFVYPNAYRSSPTGCILRLELQEDVVPYYVTVTTLLTSQSVLVGLFIYPLFVHRRVQVTKFQKTPMKQNNEMSTTNISHESGKTMETQLNTSPSNDITEQKMSVSDATTPRQSTSDTETKKPRLRKKSGSTDRVFKAIQRSVVCAVVCVLSDVAAFIALTFILPRSTPKGITNVVYDFSLWVNILSVIFSFETYRKIFTAPCSK